jgi:hypothetical protein
LVLGEELGNKVLTIVGDVVPDRVREAELAELDFLHDFLIRRTIEGRDTGQNDVGDDTA